MIRFSRVTLVAIAIAIAATACAAEPTQPSARAVVAPTAAQHDMDPGPDGTCRSGYTVANGRCVPI